MPRSMIRYASFGAGHLHAAEALRAALVAHPGVKVVVVDTLAYLGPMLR